MTLSRGSSMNRIFGGGKKGCLADGDSGGETRAVSCQKHICFRVAQRETRQAANQKATKTCDGEPEKLLGYKNSFFVVSTYALQGWKAWISSPDVASPVVKRLPSTTA